MKMVVSCTMLALHPCPSRRPLAPSEAQISCRGSSSTSWPLSEGVGEVHTAPTFSCNPRADLLKQTYSPFLHD